MSVFDCCKKRIYRFNTVNNHADGDALGCKFMNHKIDLNFVIEGQDLATFEENKTLIFSNKLPPGVDPADPEGAGKFELSIPMRAYLSKRSRAER